MGRVSGVAYTVVGALSYIYTCWTLLLLAEFLYYGRNENDDTTAPGNGSRAFWVDFGLVVLFICQHSLMTSSVVKRIFARLRLGVVERAIYVVISSVILQVMITLWQPINSWSLWRLSSPFDYEVVFVILHALSWISMTCSSLAVDYLELLGVKQIYYHLYDLGDPMDQKSATMQQMYQHSRHPMLGSLVTLLWATPCMSADRLLLAVALPLYLITRSKLNETDVVYVQEQLARKKTSLEAQGHQMGYR